VSVAREFTSHSAEQTIACGREISRLLHPGQMIVLRGDLGAGKTTLVKGIAAGFDAAPEEAVTSPTFTLVHEYRGPAITLFHLDLYRIETQRELMTLGVDDLRAEPASILLVEWGEKFAGISDHSQGEIAIQTVGECERQIAIRLQNWPRAAAGS
jgi:tRNA threonylcarbamoyladenosine biosynthesis protein TsaE